MRSNTPWESFRGLEDPPHLMRRVVNRYHARPKDPNTSIGTARKRGPLSPQLRWRENRDQWDKVTEILFLEEIYQEKES